MHSDVRAMERVLDTAALLHWPVARLNGGICAASQRNELERLSPARTMLIEAADLDWRTVSSSALDDAKVCAGASGDLPRLSDVDLDVLALALQEGAILVTDDYRLQNAYKNAGGTVESVANAPSKHVWSWEGRCVGCGATSPLSGDVRRSKNDVVGECRVCGSPVKVKRKTS